MSAWRKWSSLLAVMVVQSVVWGFGLSSFTLWANAWIKTFHVSHSEVTLAILAMHAATGLFSPAVGFLVGRYSIRALLMTGVVLVIASGWLVATAGTMWEVIAIYAIPFAAGMVLTGLLVGQVLAVKLFEKQPGFAIGVVSFGLCVGGFVMPPVVGALLSGHAWRQSYLIMLVVVAAIAVPLILFVVREPAAGDKRTISHQTASQGSGAATASAILGDRTFIGVVLIVVILEMFHASLYFNLGPWMSDLGYAPIRTALIMSLVAALAVPGMASFGALADRFDPRALLFVALVLNGGGLIVSATAPSYAVLLVVIPLTGFANGGMISLLPAILAKRFGSASFPRANGLALLFVSQSMFGALLAGAGRDLLGSYSSAFGVLTLGIAPCIVGFILLSRSMRSWPESPAAPLLPQSPHAR